MARDIDDILRDLGLSESSNDAPGSPDQNADQQAQVDSQDPSGGAVAGELYNHEEGLVLRAEISADLGALLVTRGVINNEAVSTAQNIVRQSPGRSLAAVLIEQGVEEAHVLEAVADLLGVPFERIDLDRGLDGGFDGTLFQRLGAEFCKTEQVLPIRTVGNRVVIGTTRPDDVFMLDDVRSKLGVGSVKPVLVTTSDLAGAFDILGANDGDDIDLSEILAGVEEGDVEFSQSLDQSDNLDLESQAGESPVIRYVNYIIQNAVKEGASDIHVEPGDGKLKVRFRIDGVLFESMNPPAGMSAAISSRLKIMANLDISERRVPQDGRIRCVVGGRKLDLRVSTLPTGYGEKTVMRILDTKSIHVDLEDLGFDESILDLWKQQVKQPNGIVLVTGPTGSGKTTTLYSSLRQLDKNKLNVSTVEDPIEYHLDGITQTQTHAKIGMTFAKALKALLRQDPDVIMLGEIRDQETAHTAVQAALTGHLVLSTLHTNDAPSSITRLVNIGLEPFLVGAAVNGVLAQRLIRRLCTHCRTQEPPSDDMAQFLEVQGFDPSNFWVPNGCNKCRETGYAGRVGIYELLVIDDQTRDAIARNPNVSEFRRMCLERGMTSLRADGMNKAAQGITSVQEILRVTEASA